MQIESTTHFHPQLASKAEKVFPIPLNRKTLLVALKRVRNEHGYDSRTVPQYWKTITHCKTKQNELYFNAKCDIA